MVCRRKIRLYVPCLLVFLVLVTTLDSQSWWWDEGISLHLAGSSWKEIVVDRASNIHPPLYFFILKLWVSVAGSSQFSTRYLSALAITLLPAAVYALIKPRFNQITARVASFFIAVAPPYIIYGQEVRAYGFMPLLYIALIAQIWEPKNPGKKWGTISLWYKGIILGITQIIFIGFHYSGLVAVSLSILYLFARVLLRKNVSDRRILVISIVVMALIALPWLLQIFILGLGGMLNQAGITNPMDSPIPFGYLIQLLAQFTIYGMPEAINAIYLQRAFTVTSLLLLFVFLLGVFRSKGKNLVILLGIWVLPFCCVPFIWLLSPQAHPRYLLPYFVGGWLLLAALVSQPSISKFLRSLLVAATLVSSLLGMYSYLFNTTYARSDIRAVADYLKTTALPGDIVIVPHTDWSLEQYDVGGAVIHMLPVPQDDIEVTSLLASTEVSDTVYLLEYNRGVIDPRGQLRNLLSRQGYLYDRLLFHKVGIEQYTITRPFTGVKCEAIAPVCVEDENMCLVGIDTTTDAISGGMLPISLGWEIGAVSERIALAFRLYSTSGILVSSSDDLLIDPNLEPSELWRGNVAFVSYHRIPVPLGLLPESYMLELSVYPYHDPESIVSLTTEDGHRHAAVELAHIQPSATNWVDASPETYTPEIIRNPRQAVDGLILTGSRIEPLSAAPGDNIYVTLLWDKQKSGLQNVVPQIQVIQDNRVLISLDIWGDFSHIPVNRPVLDHVLIPLPVDADRGKVDVTVTFEDTGEVMNIGSLDLVSPEYDYEIPKPQFAYTAEIPGVANLIGYEVSENLPLLPGQPFTLTIVWQAGEKAVQHDLKAFVQVLDEKGSLIAQHDAKPVDWLRPTTGWITGEFLYDNHPVQWLKESSNPGDIIIGMYDAETGTRLLWDNGEDALKLPVQFDD